MTDTPTLSTDVLVVGGGPVGLCTSMFLARQGVSTVLVEKHNEMSSIARANGLHARTMELFREYGLEPRISEMGTEMTTPGSTDDKEAVSSGEASPMRMVGAKTLADLTPHSILEAHTVQTELTPSRPRWCGQNHYQSLVLDTARDFGVRDHFGTELVQVEQDEEGVTAHLRNRRTRQDSTLRARYLIAADGVHSPVREQVGIGGPTLHGTLDLFSVDFFCDEELIPGTPGFTWARVFHPHAHGLLTRIGPDRWVFGLTYYPERGQSPQDFTDQHCIDLVRTATGRTDLDIEIESALPWQATHFVADQYRHGRVFLAGDAGHTHPPAGGFGVNLGIQDAHNLAWKLAMVLQGQAGPGLLDSYESERRPVGQATADQAWMLFNRRSEPATEEERAEFRDVQTVANGYRYHSQAVIGAGSRREVVPRSTVFNGRPGTRAPHAWLHTGQGRISSLDLFGSGFTLIAGAKAEEWVIAAKEAADALGLPLATYRLGSDVTDPDHTWVRDSGINETGALLVRPDGFVAWRATEITTSPATELTNALTHILTLD